MNIFSINFLFKLTGTLTVNKPTADEVKDNQSLTISSDEPNVTETYTPELLSEVNDSEAPLNSLLSFLFPRRGIIKVTTTTLWYYEP